jgi:hypothetical protein
MVHASAVGGCRPLRPSSTALPPLLYLSPKNSYWVLPRIFSGNLLRQAPSLHAALPERGRAKRELEGGAERWRAQAGGGRTPGGKWELRLRHGDWAVEASWSTTSWGRSAGGGPQSKRGRATPEKLDAGHGWRRRRPVLLVLPRRRGSMLQLVRWEPRNLAGAHAWRKAGGWVEHGWPGQRAVAKASAARGVGGKRRILQRIAGFSWRDDFSISGCAMEATVYRTRDT